MGFFTGFVGGIAFSYALIQLTAFKRFSYRQHQQALLREQIDALSNLSMPAASTYNAIDQENYAAALARQGYAPREGPTTSDMWKAKWNQKIESMAHSIHELNWDDIRERIWKTRRE